MKTLLVSVIHTSCQLYMYVAAPSVLSLLYFMPALVSLQYFSDLWWMFIYFLSFVEGPAEKLRFNRLKCGAFWRILLFLLYPLRMRVHFKLVVRNSLW